jgi:hypothetical protein
MDTIYFKIYIDEFRKLKKEFEILSGKLERFDAYDEIDFINWLDDQIQELKNNKPIEK